jgi:hypothetical protein
MEEMFAAAVTDGCCQQRSNRANGSWVAWTTVSFDEVNALVENYGNYEEIGVTDLIRAYVGAWVVDRTAAGALTAQWCRTADEAKQMFLDWAAN